MFNIHPNPWKTGDRVRVRADADAVKMRGRTGTVVGADRMVLGTPNDFNTSVQLDDWDPALGTPIFNDGALEAA